MGITDIIVLVGGVGLFLYGMTLMADGLEKAAGDRMKSIINSLTKNVFIAAILGAFVTIMVQSSSTTTVMVVGLVNSGLMNLVQSVGVIMGANIGTTITAWMASLSGVDFVDSFVYLSLGAGGLVYIFTSKKKYKNTSLIFIGFALLFLGMDLMKNGVRPLRSSEMFNDMIAFIGESNSIGHLLLGILIGAIFTAAIQSSSASTGIFVAMAAEGILPIESAIPLLYGANIGTCITALLSSIGASTTAKQAATVHVLFNVIGTLIFIPFTGLLADFAVGRSVEPEIQLAIAHTVFNVSVTFVLIWFARPLALLATKIVKIDPDQEVESPVSLDHRLLVTPPIAFANMETQIDKLGVLAYDCYNSSVKSFFEGSEKAIAKTYKLEGFINDSEYSIYRYINELNKTDGLSSIDTTTLDEYIRIIHDFERIGDHAENIANISELKMEKKTVFSEEAIADLELLCDTVKKSLNQTLKALSEENLEMAQSICTREDKIDNIYQQLKDNHIVRLRSKTCNFEAGILYIEMITDLERIGDHCNHIARSVIKKHK